jgi:hypothetical protein
VKVAATPFGGMFSSVAIEYSKESLSANIIVINDEGMGIFHSSPGSPVFRNAYLKRLVLRSVSIQNLEPTST